MTTDHAPIHEDHLQSLYKAALASVDLQAPATHVSSEVQLALVEEVMRLRELAASVYVYMSRHHRGEELWLDNLLAAAQGGLFDPQTLPQQDSLPNDWFREVGHETAGAVLVQRGRDGDDPAVIITIQVNGKIGTAAIPYESNAVRDVAFAEMSDAMVFLTVDKILPPLINHIPNS